MGRKNWTKEDLYHFFYDKKEMLNEYIIELEKNNFLLPNTFFEKSLIEKDLNEILDRREKIRNCKEFIKFSCKKKLGKKTDMMKYLKSALKKSKRKLCKCKKDLRKRIKAFERSAGYINEGFEDGLLINAKEIYFLLKNNTER